MTTRFRYNTLRPLGSNLLNAEPFPAYMARVEAIVPNFPPDVLEHWVYKHYGDAITTYRWLGFKRLHFEKQLWPTEFLITEVLARNPTVINSWKTQLLNNRDFQRSKLGTYMIERGTWPVPPIILDNREQQIKHPKDQTVHPLQLMEGHHRLGYLHAIVESEIWRAKPTHEIWLVTRRSAKQAVNTFSDVTHTQRSTG